jgi:hypothetical protein
MIGFDEIRRYNLTPVFALWLLAETFNYTATVLPFALAPRL